ncbi:hypothetical protein [Rhodanobacter terrae]|uniref:Uncharacterized protein n=1 Tax=Rhodanobacter terrae TaxID=418647 RepID=A0ABW0T2W9_9GAMM
MNAEAQGVQAMFVHLAAESADAVRIAEIAVSIWDDVGEALAPIIGQTSVAVLFKRSVYLTRHTHPCLSIVNEGAVPATGALAALRVMLAEQDRVEALAVNASMLQNFHQLLISLIGASLSKRLLRPV